jgi:hypothetical protein
MAINKVVYGNDTLIDLTNDTVEASNLLEGETAHDRSGTPVTGTAKQGHTIWNKIKSALTQRSKLWFKDAKVSDNSSESATVVEVLQSISENDFDSLPTDGTADGFYEIDGESGGSTGGHTIKDGDGTAMTAQPNLQFADAKVTNDAQGQVTKVQNFEDISWDDWQEVDDNDDTYYRVTDAPLVDGNVEVDLMKKLWENPSPTASFSAQNVSLNSADYDMLLIVFIDDLSHTYTRANSAIIPKGSHGLLNVGRINITRSIDYVSDTTLYFQEGYSTASNNNLCVPIAIYGIKQKVRISLSAIISNVSTSASKCMLSDGETSVEDAINDCSKVINSTGSILLTFAYSAVSGYSGAQLPFLIPPNKSIVLNSALDITSSPVDITSSCQLINAGAVGYLQGTYILQISGSSYNGHPVIANVTITE